MLTASQDVAAESSACFSRRSKTTFPGGSMVLDILSGSPALLLRNLCNGRRSCLDLSWMILCASGQHTQARKKKACHLRKLQLHECWLSSTGRTAAGSSRPHLGYPSQAGESLEGLILTPCQTGTGKTPCSHVHALTLWQHRQELKALQGPETTFHALVSLFCAVLTQYLLRTELHWRVLRIWNKCMRLQTGPGIYT